MWSRSVWEVGEEGGEGTSLTPWVNLKASGTHHLSRALRESVEIIEELVTGG